MSSWLSVACAMFVLHRCQLSIWGVCGAELHRWWFEDWFGVGVGGDDILLAVSKALSR